MVYIRRLFPPFDSFVSSFTLTSVKSKKKHLILAPLLLLTATAENLRSSSLPRSVAWSVYSL